MPDVFHYDLPPFTVTYDEVPGERGPLGYILHLEMGLYLTPETLFDAASDLHDMVGVMLQKESSGPLN